MLWASLAQSRQREGQVVLRMALGAAVGVALYKFLKCGTNRKRPFLAHPGIVCADAPLDRPSFPSGHTLHAVGMSAIASAHHPKLALFLVP